MKKNDNFKNQLKAVISENSNIFEEMSKSIWQNPEIAFNEVNACRIQKDHLKSNGFRITCPIGDLETAFYAEYGNGQPVIAILGEYDALPRLEQKAGCPHEEHPDDPGPGHGCGHNLLGTAGVEAVCALKEIMEKNNIGGTIRYYGCPAEEGGGGKSKMLKAGAFNDVSVAFSWHPGFDGILYCNGFAACTYIFEFNGISSHANLAPEAGRSALDAAELMNIGIQFLREHIKKSVNIQYAFIDAGGKSSNIVPNHASLTYTIRAHQADDMKDVLDRVIDVAKGAALMTGTRLSEPRFIWTYANILYNRTLTDILEENIKSELPLAYTSEELQLAAEFQKVGTMPNNPEPIKTMFNYSRELAPRITTDFGDVSWVVPSASFCIPSVAAGTRVHNWAMTAQTCTSYAHKAMHAAASVMAKSAMDVLFDDSIIAKAKEDLYSSLNGRNYFKLFK